MMHDLAAPLPTLSSVVVVPARDEEPRIGSCLDALIRQRGVDPTTYEVIVVLDGCRDNTQEVVERLSARSGQPPIHTVSFEDHRGVGRARRTGMDLACARLAASGRDDGLIASTDADTVVADDWLAVQLELTQAGREAIGGWIEIDTDSPDAPHPAALATRGERIGERLAEVRRQQPSAIAADHPHFSGASMALTVGAYRRCGGLPVRAALEDEALARMLTQHGIVIERSSRVRVKTSARRHGRAPRGLAHDLSCADWRARRGYAAAQFPLERLLAAKRSTVSLILPTREVQETIGEVASISRELMDAGLFDEVLVVDSGSGDETVAVAEGAGLVVVQENELMPAYGHAIGKGDAMWRGLAATTGEIVAFADTDTEDFNAGFLLGLVGPLICDPEVKLVKGAFRRPFRAGASVAADGGGRVTELMARPLLNLHFPQLAVFDQPLAGETAARRSLLERIRFAAGYGVEIAMLIDCWRSVGLDAMAQVDIGTRQNRHQTLRDLSPMSYAVLVAAMSRAVGPEFADAYACASMLLPPTEPNAAYLENRSVSVEERPSLWDVATNAVLAQGSV